MPFDSQFTHWLARTNGPRARKTARALSCERLEDRTVPAVLAHAYDFNGGLADGLGGPSLVADGGTLQDGRYVFAANQGLKLEGALADPTTYSIVMDFELDDFGPLYKKILDFEDRASDSGLYLTGSRLQFFPGGPGITDLAANTDARLVLTRDGGTGETKLYLNGLLQQTYTGVGVPSANILRFFEDDRTTGYNEAVGGSIDALAISHGALTASEIANLGQSVTTVSANQATVSVVEGGTATNAGTWSGTGGVPVVLTASRGTVTQNADGTWTWADPALDGPDSQTVTITATAADGADSSVSFSVVVENAPPVFTRLTASHESLASPSLDGRVSLDGAFADAGALDTHTVTVNWGDGSASESIAVDQLNRSFLGSHRFASGGIFTITVTLTDRDGASVTRTVQAAVAGVRLVDGTLTVVGSSATDCISISRLDRCRGEDLYRVVIRLGTGRNSHEQVFTFRASEVNDIVIVASKADRVAVKRGVSAPVQVIAVEPVGTPRGCHHGEHGFFGSLIHALLRNRRD